MWARGGCDALTLELVRALSAVKAGPGGALARGATDTDTDKQMRRTRCRTDKTSNNIIHKTIAVDIAVHEIQLTILHL